MKSIKDIAYTENGNSSQSLDLYLPDERDFPVFVYFHGGGLEHGDKGNTDSSLLADLLTRHGIALATANYRMYPDAKYPQFIEDAAAAVAWVKQHIAEYGGSNCIYVGGSSAGGYLSMMLCFDAQYLGRHGIEPASIAGFVHDAGQPTKHFNVLREQGLDTRRVIVDDTAPLYHVGASANYPPMLFIVSDNDMKNRYEQTVLMRSTLLHFGHPQERVMLKVMHGGHCTYVKQTDENGDSILGKAVMELIDATKF